jgi:hypothetical protein
MTIAEKHITADMVKAAETLFLAMAYTQTIRPIVEGYQKKIIAEIKPEVCDKFSKFATITITEAKDTYLMNDNDFQVYLKRCAEEAHKAGFKIPNDDYCPLLIAESLERDAEHALIEAMLPITHISKDTVLCSRDGLENYKKLIGLSLRLLAPFVKKEVKL